MVKLKFFLALYLINITAVFAGENNLSKSDRDHEKAIRAVNEGEILPLDKILKKVESEYAGRIISVNLKDSEKGLFGWVYDIMIIGIDNNVKQLRVDAGTSTILSVKSGGN
ncbi:MAG: hypothetical protein VX009_01105 [Pseudomonadota bacterium]|nr:hypothetical protein [Pseudomonadota bacterium]